MKNINNINNKWLKIYTSFVKHEIIGNKLDNFLLKLCYYFLAAGVIFHVIYLIFVITEKLLSYI